MEKNLAAIILVLLMIATIVAVDVLFFRHRFWERLMANVGIALIYIAVFLSFVKRR